MPFPRKMKTNVSVILLTALALLSKAHFFWLPLPRQTNPMEMFPLLQDRIKAVVFDLLLKLPLNPIPMFRLLHTNVTFILPLGCGQHEQFLSALQLYLSAHPMLQVIDVALRIQRSSSN